MNMTVTGIKQPPAEMVNRLQQGGYVLYFRHAQPAENFGDPGLSAEGQEKAVLLGNWLREQKIKINLPVLTSPTQRTQETGKAAFQSIRVEEALAYMDTLFTENPDDAELKMKARLVSLLESLPSEGSNTVLVAHSFSFNNQIEARPYLGLILLKPRGKGQGYEIVDAFNF
ncbi:histidine phosphatase family protein [Paenibacillus sp. MMS20-IR301]|uniref:histidine phosphatase family protein n=1 Tax=Paenibacillus sp. MMS20-IR301 TaxID=2895946 RepID=UPI0028EFC8D9|nr:histidine phosphatase family protein [Paenibacillus sp. MMS20-IR301]WNS46697.1 histidine phosphatase family protein [Paenibacillus sp. MMS20-IR301]